METNKIALTAIEKSNEALSISTQNKEQISEIVDRVEDLQTEQQGYAAKIKYLEDKLDDQVNRSMRSTLVIKGIEGTESSWEDTKNKLSNIISNLTENKSANIIESWIERAHRLKRNNTSNSNNDTNNNPNRARPINIVAKFTSWKHSEEVKRIIINYNKNKNNDNQPRIYVEQLQSNLASRTNEAKKYRKELRLQHPDWLMYVSHPARLFGKKPGEDKYAILKEF